MRSSCQVMNEVALDITRDSNYGLIEVRSLTCMACWSSIRSTVSAGLAGVANPRVNPNKGQALDRGPYSCLLVPVLAFQPPVAVETGNPSRSRTPPGTGSTSRLDNSRPRPRPGRKYHNHQHHHHHHTSRSTVACRLIIVHIYLIPLLRTLTIICEPLLFSQYQLRQDPNLRQSLTAISPLCRRKNTRSRLS